MSTKALLFFFLLLLTLHPGKTFGNWNWILPPLPAPHEYGNIIINRTSEDHQVKPVFFSHWSHRVKYACRVCHVELDFAFSVNSTEITEEDNINGLFCGACHNGKEAFGHSKDNCNKCHSGTFSSGKEKFEKLIADIQQAPFGNQVDWVSAVLFSQIKPRETLYNERPETRLNYRARLELTSEWAYISPAFFPHDVHSQLLDCANCHPDIFKLKKKTTPHFRMEYILEGRFCGVCHLKIAFPINDCERCHPGMDHR